MVDRENYTATQYKTNYTISSTLKTIIETQTPEQLLNKVQSRIYELANKWRLIQKIVEGMHPDQSSLITLKPIDELLPNFFKKLSETWANLYIKYHSGDYGFRKLSEQLAEVSKCDKIEDWVSNYCWIANLALHVLGDLDSFIGYRNWMLNPRDFH